MRRGEKSNKMKKPTLTTLLTTAAITATAALAPTSTDAQVRLDANTSMNSKYLASSGSLFEDRVVNQSSLTGSQGGFWGSVWANTNSNHLSEVDITAGYGKNMGPISMGAGVGNFRLRDLNVDVRDLWVDASLAYPLSPKLTLEHNLSAGEFDNTNGTYLKGNVSHGMNLGRLPLSLGASSTYNRGYFQDENSLAVVQVEIGVSLTWKGVNLRPGVRLQKAIDKDNYNDEIVTSVSASYSR